MANLVAIVGKWALTYFFEIGTVLTALAFVYGVAELLKFVPDGTFTDFQTIQLCIYAMILITTTLGLINAARARATTNEIEKVLHTEQKGGL